MNIFLRIIPYGVLSMHLISMNQSIRNTEKYLKNPESANDCEYLRILYLNDLVEKRRSRTRIMDELYRRAGWIDFDKVKKDLRMPHLTLKP